MAKASDGLSEELALMKRWAATLAEMPKDARMRVLGYLNSLAPLMAEPADMMGLPSKQEKMFE